MIFLRNRLADFELHVARYYMRRGAYVGALNRAKFCIENYDGAPAVQGVDEDPGRRLPRARAWTTWRRTPSASTPTIIPQRKPATLAPQDGQLVERSVSRALAGSPVAAQRD